MANIELIHQINAAGELQNPPKSLPDMNLGLLSAEDFAVALGLKQSSIPDFAYPRDELIRMNRVVFAKHCNSRFPAPQQNLVWSRFCALYLPATISKFINPPPAPIPEWTREMLVNNAYLDVIAEVQSSPYFWKYLRSNKPAAADNKLFAKVFTDRLLTVIPIWDVCITSQHRPEYIIDTAKSMLLVLATPLTAYLKNEDQRLVLSMSTREELVPWLTKMAQRYKGEFLGEVAERSLGIITGDKEIGKTARAVRRRRKGWEECAMQGCKNAERLKTCARCQTVRHCSPEHQREHWSLQEVGHKAAENHCFQTEY